MDSLAKRIEAIRIKAGDTPNSAAKKLGISRQAYVKWENGDTANMRLGNLTAFCEKYKVDIAELISGTPSEKGSGQNVLTIEQKTASHYHGQSNEAKIIADYYDKLPVDMRAEFRMAMVKAYLQIRLQNPESDIGDIAEVIDLVRKN